MPKSIFEVLDEYYYNSGKRTGPQHNQGWHVPNSFDMGARKLFKPSNIKPGLDTVQRMIVYSFLVRLSEAKNIDITDYTLF
jgi:hypothetical protein